MSSVIIAGDTSGSVTLQAPAVSGTTTLTLPATSGTVMVNGAAFSAYQSSAQTALSAVTWTKLLLQTEEFDTNNNFASNTFTPTVAGYYSISGAFSTNGTTTAIGVSIYKNGSQYKQGNYMPTLMVSPTALVNTILYLNGSTDYVDLYGYTATSLTPAADAIHTYFSGAMVRGA